MRRREAIGLLLTSVAAAGCGSASAPADPEPASVRLYDVASGRELTPLPTFPRGATTRVEARWFAASGGRIRGLEARNDATIDFTAGSAVARPVAGAAFQYDVAAQPAGQSASMLVTFVRRGERAGTTFGPFAVSFQ